MKVERNGITELKPKTHFADELSKAIKIQNTQKQTLLFAFADDEGKQVCVSLDEIQRVLNQIAERYGVNQIASQDFDNKK